MDLLFNRLSRAIATIEIYKVLFLKKITQKLTVREEVLVQNKLFLYLNINLEKFHKFVN